MEKATVKTGYDIQCDLTMIWEMLQGIMDDDSGSPLTDKANILLPVMEQKISDLFVFLEGLEEKTSTEQIPAPAEPEEEEDLDPRESELVKRGLYRNLQLAMDGLLDTISECLGVLDDKVQRLERRS